MRRRVRFVRCLAAVVAAFGMIFMGVVTISVAAPSAGAVTKSVVVDEGTGGVPPNFIFPMMTISKFSAENADFFQYLMYRPLYWVGGHKSTTIDYKLSLATKPTFSNGDETVKVTLKTYKWSDTEKVDTTDIMLWLNVWHQKPTAYAEWFPGGLSLPTIIKSIKITSSTTMTMTLNEKVNTHFFLTNDLQTITPLPLAWTVTSLTATAGSGGCTTAAFTTTTPKGANAAKCKAVYDFLMEQSGYNPTKPTQTIDALPTYATSKIWGVVDGPWKLTSFTATEGFTMVPNTKYSGSNKPKIKEYIDKAYTSTKASFNAMVAGSLDVGILPLTELTAPAKKAGKAGVEPTPGANNPRLASTFTLDPAALWSFTYYLYNYKSNGDSGQAGDILSQLYVREAMQHLVDQTLFIKSIDKTYGIPEYSPVPDALSSPYLSNALKTDPYPYSTKDAKSLLKSHGWKVVSGGTDTCEKPGKGSSDCGAGIKKGAKLSLTFAYSTTPTYLKTMVTAMKSAWSTAGIHVTLDPGSFDTVIGEASPCPKGCSWEMADYGGWLYTHADPTGTELFAKGAGSNAGSFSTATSTKLIVAAAKGGTADFAKYAEWEEKHLPVGYENSGVRLYEVHKGLKGVAPMDPMETLTPATFHWT